jgi:putative aldouronate transport system substrate-binding protein
MSKLKRGLSLIVAAALSASMLAGCGGGKTAGSDSSAEGASSANGTATAVENSKLDPVNLTWYFVGPGEQKDTSVVEQEVNKYLKDKINASLKLYCIDWGTYQQKMFAMISAGEPFDMCFTASWLNDYNKNSRTGAFVAINDLMDKYAPKTKALLGEDFLKASQIDGKNYAVPTNKEKARSHGLLYNKTLADKYGFDMTKIKTINDLEPMLKAIKEKQPGFFPFIGGNGWLGFNNWNAYNTSDNPEVGDITEDGKVINQFETPEFKATFETIRKYYDAGYERKDILTQKGAQEDSINKGQNFVWAVNLKPGYAAERTANNQTKEKYGFELAQLDLTEPVMCTADVMGSLTAISKTSKNPDRAMMFLELMNTDKYLNNLINYGIENKHYKKISENTIEAITDSGYSLGMQWALGNQFINYLQKAEDPNKWAQYEEFNKKAKPSPELGFIFNPDPIKNEKAACDNVISQYYRALTFGVIDPAKYLPEFLSKLKAAGGDKIIAEKQKQFDTWKATKK